MMSKSRKVVNKQAQRAVGRKLSVIDRILEACHGTPDMGNVSNPLEELIFLTIAQRTRIETAIRIFRNLKKQFPHPEDILMTSESELKKILSSGGRGNLRTKAIREIIRTVSERTGAFSLDVLKEKNENEAFDFLMSLPWVGEKIARCVMLYSLGFKTFPADENIIRILKRTDILDPMIGSLDGVEHRKAQTLIAPLVPPQISETLHINMVVHGQKICTARRPKCETCEIRKFCKSYRERERRKAEKLPFTMVDLFCGAGGISLGFHNAGFRPLMAIDVDRSGIETYSLNHPCIDEKCILQKDITELSREDIEAVINSKRVDVLVAGVPCQGYSRIGYQSKPELSREKKYEPEKDPRNSLFIEVTRIAKILDPRFILLENVPDMQHASVVYHDQNRKVLNLLKNKLRPLGYTSGVVFLDASNFGIPQRRKRLFFIAGKGVNLNNLDEELQRIAEETGCNGSKRNLSDAMGDLPVLSAGNGEEITGFPDSGNIKGGFYEKFVMNKTGILYNHIARFHNMDDMKIIRALKRRENYTALIKRKPEVLKGRRRKIYRSDNFHDKFFRLDWKGPSRTIVSHLAKDGNSFMHPEQNRSITVRESARIQTFPDDFIFAGSRSAQFIQIGNAVPPLLAYIIGLFFVKLLEKGRGRVE